jgi:hypothetical protein
VLCTSPARRGCRCRRCGPGVVAEVALIGTMVDAALLGALGYVVFDGQVIDVDLAADAELAGMIDDHVLDDLDVLGVGGVDQVLVGGSGGFQPRVDAGPVVGMVAVIVESGAVLHRRRDPDGAETEVSKIVQALDQALEVAAPMRIDGVALCVESDAVATEEVVGGVAVVKACRQQEIDGLLAEVRPLRESDALSSPRCRSWVERLRLAAGPVGRVARLDPAGGEVL